MFSRQGITLLGHAHDFEDGKLLLKDDLRQNLAKVDGFAANLVKMIDDYIQKQGLDSPTDELLSLDDGYKAAEIRALDLCAEGVKVIIWACGYSFDYSLVRLPVLDAYGYPVTDRGVTRFPGLYFLGMPWMNKFSTGLLMGIGDSARYLAEVIIKPQN